MSHLSVLKTLTVSTGFGSIIAQVDPLKTGSELGSMAPSAILGVVCVTCVVGICVLYRGKERDNPICYRLPEPVGRKRRLAPAQTTVAPRRRQANPKVAR